MARRQERTFSLTDTWLLNNRVNLLLLNELSDEQFAYAANARARSIGDQLAHLHNVRAMWLAVAGKSISRRLKKAARPRRASRAA